MLIQVADFNEILYKVYLCKACNNPLAKELNRFATHRFRGMHGPGSLFHEATGIEAGEECERNMTTGLHTVQDLSCTQCKQYVGWTYVKAPCDSEQFKVGKFLLEHGLMTEIVEEPRSTEPRL